MPNYCENSVRVYNWDTPNRVDDFINFVKSDDGLYDFNKAVPYNGAPQDGYNWCIQNWGTKWNAIEPKMERIRNEIVQYDFDTAWNPPLPVMDKLAELFSDCKIILEYYNAGYGFCGSIRWVDGKRENETQGEYYGWRGG